MPTSITAYHTFVPAQKARSSEVNTNFNNHRADLLPINADTASASDGVHDLGSDEHRWDVGYVNSVDFETSTTTATLVMKGQTSVTTGGLEILIEGVTVSAWNTSGFNGTLIADSTVSKSMLISPMITTTITGTTSFTIPSNVSVVWAKIQGGGGGGAGGGGAGVSSPGAGGGGGGSAGGFCYLPLSVTPGDVFSITVGTAGTGGNGGASSANGDAGGAGNPTIVDTNGTPNITITVQGGGAGTGGTEGSGAGSGGGAGGTVTARGGEFVASGSTGGSGVSPSGGTTGGGSVAHTNGGAGGAAGASGGGGGGGGSGIFAIGGAGGVGGAGSGDGGTGNTGAKGSGGGGGGGAGHGAGNSGGSGNDGLAGQVELYY